MGTYSFLVEPQKVQKPLGTYDFLNNPLGSTAFDEAEEMKKKYERETGFFPRIGNMSRNFVALGGALSSLMMGDDQTDTSVLTPDQQTPENFALLNMKKQLLDGNLGANTVKALGQIFSTQGVKEMGNTLIPSIGELGEALNPITIGNAMLGMVSSPFSALTGVRTDVSGAPIMTDEEQVTALKESAAIVTSTALAIGTGVGVRSLARSKGLMLPEGITPASLAAKALEKIKGADTVEKWMTGLQEMNPVLQVAKKAELTKFLPQLSIKIATGMAEGAIAGASFGMIANEGDLGDRVKQAIHDGILFGTAGSAFEVLMLPRTLSNNKKVAEAASNLKAWRDLSYDANKSVKELTDNFDALAVSDDVIGARISQWLEDPQGILEVPIEHDHLIESLRKPMEYEAQIPLPDGTSVPTTRWNKYHDKIRVVDFDDGAANGGPKAVLVPIDMYRQATAILNTTGNNGALGVASYIRNTGFIPGQAVTVNGKLGYLNGAIFGDKLGVKFPGDKVDLGLSSSIHGVSFKDIRDASAQAKGLSGKVASKVPFTPPDPNAVSIVEFPYGADIPVEKLNEATFTHGSGVSGLTKDTIDPVSIQGKDYLLAGIGFYLSDNPALIANSNYIKRNIEGKSPEPTLYQVKLDLKNPINFDKPLEPNIATAIDVTINQIAKELVDDSYLFRNYGEALIDKLANVGLDPESLKSKTGLQIMDALNDFATELYTLRDEAALKVDKSDILPKLYHGINQTLIELGYDSGYHTGGVMGGPKHRVVTLFDPKNTYGLGTKNPIAALNEIPVGPQIKQVDPIVVTPISMDGIIAKIAGELAALASSSPDAGTSLTKFDEIVAKHTQGAMLDPSKMTGLKHKIIEEIGTMYYNAIPEKDRFVIDDITKAYTQPYNPLTLKDISRFYAATNNVELIAGEAGSIVAKDKESGAVLGTFLSRDEALILIADSGQAKTWEMLDGIIPPEVFGKFMTAPEMQPNRYRPEYRQSKLGMVFDTMNINMPLLSNARQLFQSIDTMTRQRGDISPTRLLEASRLTQVGRLKEMQAIKPWDARLGQIVKEINAKRIKPERQELISDYIEALTSEQQIQGNNMNGIQIQAAQSLSELTHRIGPALAYSRRAADLAEVMVDASPKEREAALTQLQRQMKVDPMNPEFAEVLKIIDAGRELKKSEFNLGNVVRLARTLELERNLIPTDKVEFAKFHNMTPDEIKVANDISKYFDDVANAEGVAEESKLMGYLTHARMYADGSVIDAMKLMGSDAKGFIYEMARTGELDALERNPIKLAERYTGGLMRYKYFEPDFKQAKVLFKEAFDKENIEPSLAYAAQRAYGHYVSSLRGWSTREDAIANTSIQKLFDRLFQKEVDVDLKRDVVGLINKTVELGIQGFRLKAGLLDLATGTSLAFARFGTVEAASILKEGIKAIKNGSTLIKEGKVADINFSSYADPLGRVAKREVLDKLGEAAFVGSGQEHIYNMFTQGGYTVGFKRASEAANKYIKSENPSLIQLTEDAKLDSYRPYVKQRFLELINEGKSIQAAEYLGGETWQHLVPTYGLGGGPSGWHNWFGRLGGQFGTYSVWLKGEVQDMMASGSIEARYGKAARILAANLALVGVSSELDLDLSNWYTHKGLWFTGSPTLSAMGNVATSIVGNKQKAKEADRDLGRSIPSPDAFTEGQLPFYVPFGMFYNDIIQAKKAAEMGKAPYQVILRGTGVQLDRRPYRTYGEVAWEDMLNLDRKNYPR